MTFKPPNTAWGAADFAAPPRSIFVAGLKAPPLCLFFQKARIDPAVAEIEFPVPLPDRPHYAAGAASEINQLSFQIHPLFIPYISQVNDTIARP